MIYNSTRAAGHRANYRSVPSGAFSDRIEWILALCPGLSNGEMLGGLSKQPQIRHALLMWSFPILGTDPGPRMVFGPRAFLHIAWIHALHQYYNPGCFPTTVYAPRATDERPELCGLMLGYKSASPENFVRVESYSVAAGPGKLELTSAVYRRAPRDYLQRDNSFLRPSPFKNFGPSQAHCHDIAAEGIVLTSIYIIKSTS
ncbi:hypothetical protein F4774DRAFT_423837 [Daldinia eschscholtzii]|nr:hypothetical protein F4774DRAFT_423837 [Daldinia eschscholtzii]